MKYYYYHISKERKSILQLILPAIWGLFPPGPNRPLSCSVTWPEAEAYLRHYESLLQDQSLVDGVSLSMGNLQNRDNDVIGFTQFVKDRLHRQLDLVRVDIRNSPPAFLLETDDAAVNKALEFAMRLWLFSSLDENRLNPASSNAASPLLHEAVFKPGASSRSSGRRFLSKDFSAKHIMRKTDFIFKPTGNLSEHLTFDLYRTNTIRFFACAKAIEKFRFEEQCVAYDEKYIFEVQRSLQLLFPTTGKKKNAKSTKRYVRKLHSDLEAAIVGVADDKALLSSYPILGARLEEIQKRYDEAIPYRFRHWWYDRRKRVEWATLMVAIVVFILTIVFGIISSVTGILQVMAAYKWH